MEEEVGRGKGVRSKKRERLGSNEKVERGPKGAAFFPSPGVVVNRRAPLAGFRFPFSCLLPRFDTKRMVFARHRSGAGAVVHGNAGGTSDGTILFGCLLCFLVASRSLVRLPSLSRRCLSQDEQSHLGFAQSNPAPTRQPSTPAPPRGQATAATAKRKAKKRATRESNSATRERPQS